jgi:hypothetical protein
MGAKTKRPQILVCYELLEGLIDEKENFIFETKPNRLFSINIIIILEETILLLNIGVSKIIINEESKP